MLLPLPSVTEQKRLLFRPSVRFAHHTYELLNFTIFDNYLTKPKIELLSHRRKYWGMCVGNINKGVTGSFCEIQLMDKWFCPQWFVTTLAQIGRAHV